MARVTSETFAARLLRSAEQAAAIKRGEAQPARVGRHQITARAASVAEPPRYDKERVAELRKQLGLSQAVFARALCVEPATVRAWEQGHNEPSGPARRLLEIAQRSPSVITRVIQKKPRRKAGKGT